MTLMLADRINVVECAVLDALRGKPDHYIREKAWGTKLKYQDNRSLYMGLAAVGAVALGLALFNSLKD
jgi:hypothetical protein